MLGLKKMLAIYVRTFLSISAFMILGCQNFRGPGEIVGAHVSDESYEYTENSDAFDVTWPVFNGKVTQHFSLASRKPHLGIDIVAPRGSTIRASHDGRIVYAGNGFKGYGKMIIIDLDGQWATLYSHLSRLNVKNGQRIERGQILGVIGRTGNATGIHLHFEIRKNKQPTDPMKYLPSKTYITSN